ncbi:MAG TPA: exonuclease SbcCD subunit D [Gemmataceae bacterium]|nr:exonuclease SbcCD subunit D [Gemmataceae bacterium]
MKILHTADWHLGDRLGRQDRTEDLQRAVERVARLCEEHAVEVLLVAGDLFSEASRPDSLRASIAHLQATFGRFLLNGGSILALTGNHDNENFCQTLRLVMDLAAPASGQPGKLLPAGRLYLATEPTYLRLADRHGQQVQFILMPYPTPARYLCDEEAQKYASLEEKNQRLKVAFVRKLRAIQEEAAFDRTLPTILGAHVHAQGATLPSLFRISDQESIVFEENELPDHLTYIALGHIHRAQALRGLTHIRYCGSIERLDLGEARDDKGVVLLEVGPQGLCGEPITLPLEATPVYSIDVNDPQTEIPALADRYPDADRALVKLQFTYTAGRDSLEEILRDLEKIFPKWYDRKWTEAGSLGQPLTIDEVGRHKSFEDTVRDYLRQELINHPDAVRDAVLARAEALLTQLE